MICISNCSLNTVLCSLILLIIIKTHYVNSKSISTTTTELVPFTNEFRNSSIINGNHKNDSDDNNDSASVIPRKSEARETRWSYYYMGQWIWHFPLWFLLYFVWYIVFSTVRSIYNHTVSIQN